MEDVKKNATQQQLENNPNLVSGDTGYKSSTICVNRIGQIIVYEVTDAELTILEEGDNGGIYLNVSIALFSICITLLTSIATCEFKSAIIKGFFIASIAISLIIGVIFLILYSNSRKKSKDMYKK